MHNLSTIPRPGAKHLRGRHSLARSQSGAETVEVALTLAFFVTLILIVVEMALYLYAYLSTGNLAREAVRYAVVRGNEAAQDSSRIGDAPATQDSIRDFVTGRRLVSPVDIAACWPSEPDNLEASCVGSSPPLNAGVNNLPGMGVSVTVSHRYQPFLVPQWFEEGRTLTATSQGTILY